MDSIHVDGDRRHNFWNAGKDDIILALCQPGPANIFAAIGGGRQCHDYLFDRRSVDIYEKDETAKGFMRKSDAQPSVPAYSSPAARLLRGKSRAGVRNPLNRDVSLMKTIIVIAAVALLVISAVVVDRSHKRQLVNRMRARPPRSDQDFASLFPPDQSRIAPRVRAVLQKWVDIDLSRAIPDDEICRQLGLGRTDGMDVDEFLKDIEEEFSVTIPVSESRNMKTLTDLAAWLAAKQQAEKIG